MKTKSIADYKAILAKYLPDKVLDEMLKYLMTNGISFVITNKRRTKLGDYRCPQRDKRFHRITVNGDLNRYAFLLVLLHEIAHYEMYMQYRNTIKPHGEEWQRCYSDLLAKYIDVFPSHIRPLMLKYTSVIPLKKAVENEIMDALRVSDDNNSDYSDTIQLKELQLNTTFVTLDGRVFKIMEKRRTRYRCVLLSTGQIYLVPGCMRVRLYEIK